MNEARESLRFYGDVLGQIEPWFNTIQLDFCCFTTYYSQDLTNTKVVHV